jgi:hypothetical protein
VFLLGSFIYLLYTDWDDLGAQYRSQELFRDRILTLLEVLGTVLAGMFAVALPFGEGPRQTGMGPWNQVFRVVFAPLLLGYLRGGLPSGLKSESCWCRFGAQTTFTRARVSDLELGLYCLGLH